MAMIYLDNAATTEPAAEVVEALLPYLREHWGNPSSIHPFGASLQTVLEEARAQVARLIGAKHTSEILFTSGGTESNLTAIRSALATQKLKRHIITTAVEHSSIDKTCRQLLQEGVEVTFLPVDHHGALDLTHLKEAIRPETALVSIMWANNETGVIFPIQEIAKLCAERKILFHTDAVQAIGKIPIEVKTLSIDFLSIAGHKLHAPKGVGGLYVRRGAPFQPLVTGGSQERNRRAGTENVAGIVGLGKATELAKAHLWQLNETAALRDRLEKGILAAIPKAIVNGASPRLPTITNIAFPHLESEAILMMLGEAGICAASGSACTSYSVEPSRILKGMKIADHLARGSVRFSLSRTTTSHEIDHAIPIITSIVEKLYKVTPATKRRPARS